MNSPHTFPRRILLAVAQSLIGYAQKPEEEKATHRRFFHREEEQRIDRGENILDILRSVLESGSSGWLLSQAPSVANALDEYRL